MDFSITTYGGGEVLWQIFNGIAIMLHGSGESYFGPILKLAIGFGGFLAAISAIYKEQGGVFSRQWVIPSFLLLNLFMLPKTSIHIYDPVDSVRGHYYKVDNVPVGLAMVASLPNKLMTGLTQKVEDTMMPASAPEVSRFTHTGPMFAARLIAASQHLSISDPTLKQNVKDFSDRCFWWPYVVLDIDPGATAARESKNILDFVAQDAHPSLGIYWREQGQSRASFKVCKDCVPLIKSKIASSMPNAYKKLSSMLGLFQEGEQTNPIIQSYVQDAWAQVLKESASAHEIVGQQMALNAAREAADDRREELGLSRLNTRLTSLSATRAWEAQKEGWLINGALAARHLPMIQNVMTGLLVMMFLLVLPMTFIPGGFGTLGTWIKMMVWVNSWPIFYAFLNVLGVMWLAKSKQSGITFETQYELADHAFDIYTLVQGLSWSIPFLSWAFISKGGYAMVQMVSGLTSNLGQSVGQSIADNNHSIDVQNFRNRQELNHSVAQQQLGGSWGMAETINDGTMVRTIGVDGTHTFQHAKSQLLDDVNYVQSLQDMYKQSAARNSSLAESDQVSINNAQNQSIASSKEVVTAFANNEGHIQGFSESENKQISQSNERFKSAMENYSEQNTNNSIESGSVAANASVGFKSFGIGASVDGRYALEKNNQETISRAKEYGLTERDLENVVKGLNYALEKRATFSTESSARSAETLRESNDQVRSFSEQKQSHLQKSMQHSQMADKLQSISGSISSNINDDILKYTADRRFKGDLNRAAEWARQDRAGFQSDAQQYLKGFMEHNASWMKDSKSSFIDKEMMNRQYDLYKENAFQNTKPIGSEKLAQKENELGLGQKNQVELAYNNRLIKHNVDTRNERPIEKSKMVKDHYSVEQKFDAEQASFSPKRLAKKLYRGAIGE